jgi:hypothetical protein
LNGIFSVLISALAVFISINLSISVNFYIAAACYLVLLVGLFRIKSQDQASQAEQNRAS